RYLFQQVRHDTEAAAGVRLAHDLDDFIVRHPVTDLLKSFLNRRGPDRHDDAGPGDESQGDRDPGNCKFLSSRHRPSHASTRSRKPVRSMGAKSVTQTFPSSPKITQATPRRSAHSAANEASGLVRCGVPMISTTSA